MKRFLFLLICAMFLYSCGTTQRNISAKTKANSKPEEHSKASEVVAFSKGYLGTSYQYGGTSEKGMDCSGLIYMSFINGANIYLPRTTKELAKEGKRIPLRNIQKGDLVFFKTKKLRVKINHAGLVIAHDSEGIHFIHASTSKGVMISSLNEPYWSKAFAHARRVL